jgi:Ankyrin repeats (3 copies)
MNASSAITRVLTFKKRAALSIGVTMARYLCKRFFLVFMIGALINTSLATGIARAAPSMSLDQATDYLAGLDVSAEICRAKYPELKDAFAKAMASSLDEPTRRWAQGVRAAPTFPARLANARRQLMNEKSRVESECLEFYNVSDALKDADKNALEKASAVSLKTFKRALADLRYLERGNPWFYGFMIDLADKAPDGPKMLAALVEKAAPLRSAMRINDNLVANLAARPCTDCRGRDEVFARALTRVATFAAGLESAGLKTIPGGNTSKVASEELSELVIAWMNKNDFSQNPSEDRAELERQIGGDPKLLFANSLGRTDLRGALSGAHPDPRRLNAQGVNLLFYALDDEKYADLALKLIQSGIDATWRTKDHSVTALMLAAGNSSPEVLRLLIKMQLPLNQLSRDGSSALSYANAAGRSENAKLLLDAGADPKFK